MLRDHFKKAVLLPVMTSFLLFGMSARAMAQQPFDEWLVEVKEEASKNGISDEIIEEALDGIQPIQRVISLDKNQPTKKMTFEDYEKRIVSDYRIKKGRELLKKHRPLLDKVSQQYGVAPQYIVALWGVETNFGKNQGGFDVVTALATLAWEGRRGDYFRKELMTALQILEDRHIDHPNMKGSWAGAMGQCQFMPTSFEELAVDFDKDGKKDIWTNLSDVFGSAANYLNRRGWNAGERWGRPVELPDNFARDMVYVTGEDKKFVKKSLDEWKALGVELPGGGDIPVVAGMESSLVAPDGMDGPVFLVYDNFRTIMKWNNSTYFATSVGLLADAIIK
jgi:membrane-bound lytic murein transglycosylase B